MASTRIERALVSGASSGIGEEFARALAARGIALTLVARRRERLEALADELEVDCEVLPADLTEPAERAEVEKRLADGQRPVDLLVNNAGFGGIGTFTDMDLAHQTAMIELNVLALVRLTRAALEQQVTRGTGGVINVGSTAGFQPDPNAATYGGTKAFVRSFTEAIAEELRGEPVRVMLLAPGVTITEFGRVAGVDEESLPAPAVMDARSVVTTALRDYARGRTVSVPGMANSLTALGASVVPSALSRRISGVVHRRFEGRT